MDFIILGSSHAEVIRGHLERVGQPRGSGGRIEAAGIRGGRLGSAGDRRRLVEMAARSRATRAVVMLGGNDLCGSDIDLPELERQLIAMGEEMVSGAGILEIFLVPVLPRLRIRGPISCARYEQRRGFLNLRWARRFRRPPMTVVDLQVGRDMIRSDGVHLSPAGCQFILAGVRRLQREG